jgi:AcrR family transcriptional regulator
MRKRSRSSKNQRLTREEWLSGALQVLSREGGGRLRVEALAESLGLTTGSFYWHFKNRRDFVHSLIQYWDQYSTGFVIQTVNAADSGPEDKLLTLMLVIVREDLARYDVPFNAWATQDSEVERLVKKVLMKRFTYARRLFTAMGFRGDEVDVRVRALAGYMTLEVGLTAGGTLPTRMRRLKRFHAMLTVQ